MDEVEESDLVAVVELWAAVLRAVVMEEQMESGHLHYPVESGAERSAPSRCGPERTLALQRP